jgi:MFS family permease
LSDKLGRRPIVTIAMIGSTVGFMMLAFSTGIELLFAGMIVLGLSIGAVFPVAVALISDNVDQSERGFSMGMFETTCAAGFMLAATFGGILSDLYSPRMPYMLAGTVALACAIIFAAKRAK